MGQRGERRLGRAAAAEKPEASAGPPAARWILRALLGETLELSIAGRCYRLSLERAFRLEEVHGSFVFFMGTAGALERRLIRLAGGSLTGVGPTGDGARHRNSIN